MLLILIDYVFKHGLDNNNLGIVLKKSLSARYPEQKQSDLVKKIKKATDQVAARGGKAWLLINVKKTKVINVTNKPEDINVNKMGIKPLENITNFT